MEKPLRILAIVNLPWDPRLGAARVWRELSDQWQKAGHTVEKFCLTDAFPRPTSLRGLAALRQVFFPYRALQYVRRNADRFDVIDCLIGTLPFSKSQTRFAGLLVARSVGLYRSYEHFGRLIEERWPDQPRGKLLGRFFYRFTGRRLRQNSGHAIRHCDLINLPNKEEKPFLDEDCTRQKPVIVEPYGLNERDLNAFSHVMQSAETRLEKKEICFIGMWGLRKGARDWAEIIRHVQSAMPEAKFVFLGTMTDEATVFKDLNFSQVSSVRCVPTYDPAELPALLAPCAVGIFPSYIEGFGIAVLEQLACGIPTVAYDVPGPRQIFEAGEETLLTPAGDPKAIAERALEILRLSPDKYSLLSGQCRAIAQKFRWEQIASDTIHQYRQHLANLRQTIVFTQPFGVASASGGGRIVRSLLQDAPVSNLCICTAPAQPAARYNNSEIHLPVRPSFGRIERTRFLALPHAVAPLFRRRFVKKLEIACRRAQARGLHAIAHGGVDFYHAYRLARKLRIPFFLQVHDDVVYTSGGRAPRQLISRCLAEAWCGADARFVISNELGEEYNKRYGEREFVIVTDGLDHVAAVPRPSPRQLRIYFMGLFHLGYERNLQVLIEAIESLSPELDAGQTRSITLRCDFLRPALRKQTRFVRVLPFGSEADVQADFAKADLLYLPMPFGEEHRAFGTYSLSTKMVTYLGSGIPILYHGPIGTAAHTLLSKHQAAALVTSLDPMEMADTLAQLLQNDQGATIAANALNLARRSFLRREQHEKFWNRIVSCLNHATRDGVSAA